MRITKNDTTADMLKKLSADRVAAGTCRHCGGPCPCWSPYGDVRPGVRQTKRKARV